MSAFDPHAWIRRFESAGGELKADDKAWSSTLAADAAMWPIGPAAAVYNEIAGPEHRADRNAVHLALRWRGRQPTGAA